MSSRKRKAFSAWIRREYGGTRGYSGIHWGRGDDFPAFVCRPDGVGDAGLWEEWQGFKAGWAARELLAKSGKKNVRPA